MEFEGQDNASLKSNTSGNVSQVTTKEYVFSPISYPVKLLIFSAMLFFGVYGMIGNSLILYLKHKQHRRPRNGIPRSFSRSLTEYFINSLALSDVLCSLVSFPLFASEMFIDFVHNDWICKANRFLNIVFPVITIFNLLVIGIERYVACFYPFVKPSRRTAKKIVVGAWVGGAFIALVPIPTYKLIYYEIEENSYTFMCKYDNSVALYQGLFIGFIFVIYFAPTLILILANVRILNYIRRYRNIQTRFQLGRLKATRMFVSLIFAFIIPYSLFFVYNGLIVILRPKVPIATDYLTRHAGALLSYANGAISATILFHNERNLRKMFFDMTNSAFAASHKLQITPKRFTREQNAHKPPGCNPRHRTNNVAVISTEF